MVGRQARELSSFFKEQLWQTDLSGLSPRRRRLYHLLRIVSVAVKTFADNHCLLLASALTYTTLLSLVPLLALMFSILKGLGFQNRLEPILVEKLSAGSEQVVSQIVRYIDRTNVRTLGTLGLLGLIVTAISVIGNIELALNKIWGVEKTRSLGRKCSDYLSIFLICPILAAAALGLTSTLHRAGLVRAMVQLPGASQLVLLLAMLSPYLLLWIALTFVYSYLPNTTVPFKSALFGGVIAGTLGQFAQWAYIHFQVGAAKYNAIYGAFAQLPIFLVWLYLGWAIVLLGAGLAYAHQNIRGYWKGLGAGELPYSFREELGLVLLALIAQRFCAGTKPWTARELSSRLGVPARLVSEMLRHQCQSGILLIAHVGSVEAYLLAAAPETVRLDEVIEAIRNSGAREIEAGQIAADENLRKILDQVKESRRSALSGWTLRDMLAEPQR